MDMALMLCMIPLVWLKQGNLKEDGFVDRIILMKCSTKCTAWNGRILIIGFAQGTIEKIPANRLLLKNISAV